MRQRAISSLRSMMVEATSRGDEPPSTMILMRPWSWSRTCSALVHSDAPLRFAPDLGALSGRKAVRDERRLERHDGVAALERVAHLGIDHEDVGHQGIAPILPTQRAAAVLRRGRLLG